MPSEGYFRLGWEIFVSLCGVVGGVVGMWATLNFAKRATVDRIMERLTKIEAELHHMPDGETIEALRRDITTMNSRLSELSGGVAAMNKQVMLMNEYLMEHKFMEHK